MRCFRLGGVGGSYRLVLCSSVLTTLNRRNEIQLYNDSFREPTGEGGVLCSKIDRSDLCPTNVDTYRTLGETAGGQPSPDLFKNLIAFGIDINFYRP